MVDDAVKEEVPNAEPGGDRVQRYVDIALAVIVVALTLAHVAYYFPRVVDDLFISLRYADNLAHGKGAVFNVGERVEGYSGPAWMFLQALGTACSSSRGGCSECVQCSPGCPASRAWVVPSPPTRSSTPSAAS